MAGILSRKLTRRTMFKVSAAAAALAAAGEALFGDLGARMVKAQGEAAPPYDETVYSWCRQCALPPCGIKVDVKDGVAVRVQGNPECPSNLGALCSRGNATIAGVYNPYRVKAPLKRTNPERGLDKDPGWVEISWDEAMETIAAEMKKVRADDPRKFMYCLGFARSGSMLEGMEFCEAFGTPNYIEVDGPTCSVHFGSSLLLGNFVGPAYDPNYTRLLIQLGDGSPASGGYAPDSADFASSISRGMKVIVIDPRLTTEASKGEWVPIRPGTDLAFILAMQQTIVHELKRFDVEFLKRRTNAPYLIGPDDHYVRDKASNKPLVWDAKASAAKTFDDATVGDYALEGSFTVEGVSCEPAFAIYKRGIASYTPEWAEEKTTIPAATVRRIAQEFVEEARIGSTITIDGMVMPFRPVCLQSGRGAVTQFYGGNYHCAAIMVNMLVGALDVPGSGSGGLGPQHKCTPIPLALKPDADGVVLPKVEALPRAFEWPPNRLDGKTFFPYSHDNPHIVFDAILDPKKYYLDYTPEVLYVWAGNPILRVYDQEKVLKAFEKFRFIFTLSYSVDEPALLADIVLPEAVGLERYSGAQRGALYETPEGLRNAVFGMVAQQVIKPVYNSRQPDDVLIELAERIGILYGPRGMNAKINTGVLSPVKLVAPFLLDLDRKYSAKELANLVFKSSQGAEADVDAQRNVAKMRMRLLPSRTAYPYSGFPMGTTRYALYMENLLCKGEELRGNIRRVGAMIPGWDEDAFFDHYKPVVHWMDHPKADSPDFDLWAINWKTAQFSFGLGGSVDNPWLHEAAQFDPYLHLVCLNRATGEARGFKDGDLVWVESEDSGCKVQGRVKLSEAFHPDVVGIGGLFGHRSQQMNPLALQGIHFNSLMNTGPETADPLGGGFDGRHKVKVYKVE